MRALRRRYGAIRYKPGATAHGFVRRGPATDAIWARVVGATKREWDKKEPISVEAAKAIFDSDKRMRMVAEGDGTEKYPFGYRIQGAGLLVIELSI